MRSSLAVAGIAVASVLCLAVGGAGAETATYSYDPVGRLIGVTLSDGTQITYAYDDAGNRTSKITNPPTNQPPTAVTDTKTTPVSTALTFDPRTNDSDPNGDPLTITAKTNPSHGTVVINSGVSLTYTPTTGYSGSDSFTYTISDGSLTAVGTVNMTITAPANQPPVANDDFTDANAYYAGGAWVYPEVTFDPRTNDTDPNSNPLTITGVTQPASGTVTFNGSSVTYTYAYQVHPTGMDMELIDFDSFTYTISDGQGGTDTATVNVNVVVW